MTVTEVPPIQDPLDGMPPAAGPASTKPPSDRGGQPKADAAPKSKRRSGGRSGTASPGAPSAGTGRPPGRPPKPKLQDKLTEQIVMIGMAVGAAGLRGFDPSNPVPTPLMRDSAAIMAGAPRLAEALVKVADENPAVKKALEQLVTVSTYGSLIGAVAAIAVPIASNHGLVPPELAAVIVGAPAPAGAPT